MSIFKHTKISLSGVLGALAIMLAALLWSIDGLFLRPRFYVLSPELLVFWEHFLGFIVLSPFIFIFWPKIKAISRKSWLAIFWISLFGGLIGTIYITKAFFAAFDGEVSFATVVILQKLQPIFALLLARIILKEKLPRQFYAWALLAISASYILAFAGSGLTWQMIDWQHNAAGFAVIAAFAFGSSTVFGKRIANHLDYRAVAALRFALTSLLALLLIIPSGVINSTSLITSSQWSFLALIVLTSGAGAMFIYYFGLRRVSASAATILELFWPFSAIILDYFFNHNYLNLTQSIAFVLLLIAFIKISLLKRTQKMVFKAKVIKGQGKGKALGFATANLDKVDLDIVHGIYAVAIKVKGKKYLGLMHFGYKDIFKAEVSLEVLIKDFSIDIYGETVAIQLIKKIREVKSFDNPEELKQAINNDLKMLSKISF